MVAAVGSVATSTFASTFTWDNGSGNANWSNPLNWTGVPDNTKPTINDAAILPTPIPGGVATLTIQPGEEALSVTFNDSYIIGPSGSLRLGTGGLVSVAATKIGTFNMPLASNSGLTKTGTGILALGSTSNAIVGPITIAAGTLAAAADGSLGTLTNNVALAPDATFRADGTFTSARTFNIPNATSSFEGVGSNTFTLTGSIVGGGAAAVFQKTGYGFLTLASANTYAGATNITQGGLNYAIDNALPTNSAVTVGYAGALYLNNFNATIGSLAGAGFVALGTGSLTVGGDNSSTSFSGNIVQSGALVKVGSGTLTLTGTVNTHASTTINGGTLSVSTDLTLGSSGAPVAINGGTLAVTSSFTSARPINFAFTPAGSTLDIAAGKTLTYSGVIGGGGGGSGNFRKAGDGTLLLTNHSNFSGGSAFNIAAGTVKLGIDNALPTDAQINGSFGGTLDLNGFNQTVRIGGPGLITNTGATQSTYSSIGDSSYTFNGVVAGNVALVFGGSRDVFLGGFNANTGPTTILGGNIVLQANNVIPATSALVVQSGYIDLGGYSDAVGSLSGGDGGTVELYTGTLTTGANNLSTSFTGIFTGDTGKLVKVGTGRLQVNALRIGGVTVTGGRIAIASGGPFSHTSKLTNLAVGVNGQFDLADNKLIVTGEPIGTANGAIYTGLSGLIQSGRNGGAWNGNGIITTLPDAAAGRTAIGIALASDTPFAGGTYGGLPVVGSNVLIGYTLVGDSNLDGVVNFSDLLALSQNYGITTNASWSKGDDNYDGAVDFADLLGLAQNYNPAGLSGALPFDASSFSPAFAADWALAQSLVPEPGSMIALASASAMFASRRRRNSSHL